LPSVSSLEEAAEALASAHARGERLSIGRDLTTEGLDRILEHEAGDLTCTVESGLRLSELDAELARHGQRLSLDPPGNPTIGSLLALNLSGPLRHHFGAPRDLVLGVTLVLADGTIASAGGKVVKNVAGYDLARLVCGSRGRLGLIARASFRLHPLPKAQQTLVAETSAAAPAVAALLSSHLQPSALDILYPGRIAVLFEGAPRAVGAQVESATRLLEELGAIVTRCHEADVWDEARARQGSAQGRIRFEPGRLGDVLTTISEGVVRPAAGVAYVPEPVHEDVSPGVQRLTESIRRAFDPQGVLAA
jgi:glycolate oxidase FAD binding subunit